MFLIKPNKTEPVKLYMLPDQNSFVMKTIESQVVAKSVKTYDARYFILQIESDNYSYFVARDEIDVFYTASNLSWYNYFDNNDNDFFSVGEFAVSSPPFLIDNHSGKKHVYDYLSTLEHVNCKNISRLMPRNGFRDLHTLGSFLMKFGVDYDLKSANDFFMVLDTLQSNPYVFLVLKNGEIVLLSNVLSPSVITVTGLCVSFEDVLYGDDNMLVPIPPDFSLLNDKVQEDDKSYVETLEILVLETEATILSLRNQVIFLEKVLGDYKESLFLEKG